MGASEQESQVGREASWTSTWDCFREGKAPQTQEAQEEAEGQLFSLDS